VQVRPVQEGSGDNPDAVFSRDADNGPMRFLGHIIVTGLALWVTALLLPGMHLGDDSATVLTQVLTIGAIALILALINTIVKPILELLTLPITCLTLGLFQLVINTLMLLLASWVSGLAGLTLTFDSFWWALGAGVIIGILSAIVEGITGLGDERRSRSRSAGE
jgi:putative membrane protein